MAISIFVITITLNILAGLFALKLVQVTGRRLAWSLIAGGLGLMALQKSMMLYDMVMGVTSSSSNLAQALVSLIVALLLIAGVALIAPLLHTFLRHEEIREVLNERTVMTHQLHDEVLRTLHQIHVAVEVGKPPSVILSQVNSLSHSVQTFSEDLQAGLLVGNSFGTALRSLIENLAQEAPLPIHVEIDPAAAGNLTKEQGTHLLHITREAVSNSQKHAQAKKGRVSLQTKRHGVALEIADNGRGFEVDLVEAQGHGLGSMVARARKIGARLKINSRPKRGTKIYIEVPLNGVPAHT